MSLYQPASRLDTQSNANAVSVSARMIMKIGANRRSRTVAWGSLVTSWRTDPRTRMRYDTTHSATQITSRVMKNGTFSHDVFIAIAGSDAAPGCVHENSTGKENSAIRATGTSQGVSAATRSGARRRGTLQVAPVTCCSATMNR